ncbi:hypothetical protein F886_00063 [Acinetobacter sp. NIPH 542]|uniref:hypothetical protein n=1 Tax=Acinetobacter sp. NIPH 542 TaxID=1217688 RepID=UPI0002D02B89|nr:hypothetical protein [Acinetobacter sp. NIPH 542]ENX48262.1 hypothetical protein F886_00063 [Acinetobacter sp. NIPH 542]
MQVETFVPFTTEELVNQINTGLTYISNPFELKDYSKSYTQNAIPEAIEHFKKNGVVLDVSEVDGEVLIVCTKN